MDNLWEKIQPFLLPFFFTILGAYLNKIFDSWLSMRRLKKEALCKRAHYRQEWVNSLRREMAGFFAIATQHSGLSAEYTKYADDLSSRMALILFHLNPKEDVSKEIETCLQTIIASPLPAGEKKDLEKFKFLSQAILKFEWERIKRELAGQEGEPSHSSPKDAMELYNSWIKKPVAGGTASR